MRVKVSTFLYNLQQPTKKIDLAVYTNILHELKIPPHLVSNTLKEVYSDEEKEEETEQIQGESEKQQRSEQSSGSQSKASGSKTAEPKNQTNKKTEQETKGKNGLTIKDVKLLDRLYSKGPASFGSSKRLQDLSKLPMTKVKKFLETKPSFTNIVHCG